MLSKVATPLANAIYTVHGTADANADADLLIQVAHCHEQLRIS